jgi:hypothetical protein
MVAELLCLGVEPDLTGLDGLAMRPVKREGGDEGDSPPPSEMGGSWGIGDAPPWTEVGAPP